MKLPLLIRIAYRIADNAVYRGLIRRRQALVMRQFDGRSYKLQHRIQQYYWEWWLDRFEMTAQHLGRLNNWLEAP